MKRQDFYNEGQALFDAKTCEQDMAVRHLLEPKYAPKCDIEFRRQEGAKRGIMQHFIHFSSVAAALVVGLIIGVSINHSNATENERIIAKAIEKHVAVESFYSEGVTSIKTHTFGNKNNPDFQPLNNEVKYSTKIIRKNGVIYYRTEYQDKNSTVEICDGKTLSTWANGKRIAEISIGKVDIPILNMINSEDAVSYLKEELGVSAAIIERGNRLVMSYRSKNDNNRYVAYHFSKKDKALISSLMYKIVDGKIVLLQSMNKIVCDQEISLEEILAKPKK